VIALAQLMVVLDMTIVNIALPHTQTDLHISVANRQWMITAYTLAFGGLLLLGGRISDLIGRKRTFLIGLVGFGLASAVGGAAESSSMLFAARAVQGVFAALLAPSALSLLTTTFTDPRERSKAFGVFGAIAGGGSAIGLIAGGLLTEYLSWRWCMYVNVPIAVLAGIGAIFLLHGGKPENADHKVDIPGAILGCGGLVAVVYGFTLAETRGWSDSRVLGLLIGGVVLLVLFGLVERVMKRPMLPPHVVADRNRAGAFIAVALVLIGMFGLFLFLTYFLQVTKGYSPVRTGLAFLPMTAAIITGSTQIGARLMTRVPARVLIVPGLLLAAGGMAVLLQLKVDSSYTSVVLPAELLLGLGMGCVMMPSMSTATAGVAPRDAGVTSAMVNTSQQVGGSIGTALLNTIAATAATKYLTSHPPRSAADLAAGTVHGYTVAVAWGIGILVVAALVALVLINARPARSGAAAQTSVRPAPAETAEAAQPVVASAPEVGAAPVDGVHGRVLGADATPVPDTVLTLIEPGGRQIGRTIADAGGAFHLPGVESGRYVLVAAAPHHHPQASEVTLNGHGWQADLKLDAMSWLAGVVRDDAAEPVPNARVTLVDAEGTVIGNTLTDRAGQYRMAGVPTGAYTIIASGYAPTAEPLNLTDPVGAQQDLVLRHS
jgi:EmrB/QacA subfamily drug resistance transporter